jgi:hypothetical protein
MIEFKNRQISCHGNHGNRDNEKFARSPFFPQSSIRKMDSPPALVDLQSLRERVLRSRRDLEDGELHPGTAPAAPSLSAAAFTPSDADAAQGAFRYVPFLPPPPLPPPPPHVVSMAYRPPFSRPGARPMRPHGHMPVGYAQMCDLRAFLLINLGFHLRRFPGPCPCGRYGRYDRRLLSGNIRRQTPSARNKRNKGKKSQKVSEKSKSEWRRNRFRQHRERIRRYPSIRLHPSCPITFSWLWVRVAAIDQADSRTGSGRVGAKHCKAIAIASR